MTIGAPQYKDNNTATLSATYEFPGSSSTDLVLAADDAYLQTLDCGGGARTIVMPAGDGTQGGRCMIINMSDAAEAITVQQSDASTTVLVIDQNESAEVVCNGQSTTTGWQAVGVTES